MFENLFFKKALIASICGFICLLILIVSPILANAASQKSYELKIPLGLDEEAFKVPQDNPMTKEKIELGRLLFFDKRLSANNTIACASCHIPSLAFTDGQPIFNWN